MVVQEQGMEGSGHRKALGMGTGDEQRRQTEQVALGMVVPEGMEQRQKVWVGTEEQPGPHSSRQRPLL